MALPPDSDCYTYAGWRWEEGECGDQWWDWDQQCEEWWTLTCERVDREYWNSDIDFSEPTRPREDCAEDPMEMSDDCKAQWENLLAQCNDETDTPYWWTDDCDMAEMFEEAWGIWYSDTPDWWALNLKREHKKKNMQSKNAARKAAAKHTTAASKKSAGDFKSRVEAIAMAKTAAIANQTSAKNDFASGTATGVAVGAVGILGAYIALKACQRKSETSDNFERLLQ